MRSAVERIGAVDETEGTRAVEISQRGFSLSLTPFDISARFRAIMQAHPCAWIFTSATLSLGEDFGHFTSRLGLDEVETLKIDSPFDYERQSILYLPQGLPDPAAAGYVAAVIDTAIPLIEASRGGAFLLFTSHRALAQAASLLRERWGANTPYQLYIQGEAPRERLLEAFRLQGNGVLLGTTSFWEGVDVKGEALRLVIIEKLPFASPEDPIVKARIDHLQANGGNAFRDYQLPEAALALKQGVGRLIRSEEDYGAVVICDPRLLGTRLWAGVPRCAAADDDDQESGEARRFLQSSRHPPAPVARRGMKILAIDTATELCSVALSLTARLLVREIETDRGHAAHLLPMIDAAPVRRRRRAARCRCDRLRPRPGWIHRSTPGSKRRAGTGVWRRFAGRAGF